MNQTMICTFSCSASDWKLDSPEWSGRLRIISRGKDCIIRLEDKTTGKRMMNNLTNLEGLLVYSLDNSDWLVLYPKNCGPDVAILAGPLSKAKCSKYLFTASNSGQTANYRNGIFIKNLYTCIYTTICNSRNIWEKTTYEA